MLLEPGMARLAVCMSSSFLAKLQNVDGQTLKYRNIPLCIKPQCAQMLCRCDATDIRPFLLSLVL